MQGLVKGLSDRRRLPRLGKIRLGERRVKEKTGQDGKPYQVEYPAELDYFKFDAEALADFPAIRELYGEQPKELDIALPGEDPTVVFPTSYKLYGLGRLKCKGDGETARRSLCLACLSANPKRAHADPAAMSCRLPAHQKSEYEWIDRPCPCELLKNADRRVRCSPIGSLMVLLPRITLAGVWQLDTGSENNIEDINSAIAYVRDLCGRAAMVPLRMRRGTRTTAHDGKAQTHYTVELRFLGMPRRALAIQATAAQPVAALIAPSDIEPPHDEGDDLPPVAEPSDSADPADSPAGADGATEHQNAEAPPAPEASTPPACAEGAAGRSAPPRTSPPTEPGNAAVAHAAPAAPTSAQPAPADPKIAELHAAIMAEAKRLAWSDQQVDDYVAAITTERNLGKAADGLRLNEILKAIRAEKLPPAAPAKPAKKKGNGIF